MKLYVWTKILKDHSFGIAFALAEEADSARELITKRYIEDGLASWMKYPNWPDFGVMGIKTEDGIRANYRAFITAELAKDPTVYDVPVGFYLEGGA